MKISGLYCLLLNGLRAEEVDEEVDAEPPKYPVGSELKISQIATFEISINDEVKGEIEIGLFGDVVPRTVKNFASLCAGWTHPETQKTYSYAGSKIHRIAYDFVIQGYNPQL